jgi:DNA-binding MarR family transcriptional regulator
MRNTTPRPRFERGTGFLLSRLGSMAERSWATVLARFELTQAQYALLIVLERSGPTGQGRLADLIAVDQRNVVMVIDAVVARGLVERRSDSSDGRRKSVHLTPTGRRKVVGLGAAARKAQDAFLKGLGRDDRNRLNALLQRAYDSLTAAGEARGTGSVRGRRRAPGPESPYRALASVKP